MGSLNHSNIPIVGKQNITFRKRDIRITKEASLNDTIANAVTVPHVRTITSGSIVRANGAVEYYEDKVWGAYMMGRSNQARIASAVGLSRSVVVDLVADTIAVVPTGLAPHTPQISHRNLGDMIVEENSVGDLILARISGVGVFEPGFPS